MVADGLHAHEQFHCLLAAACCLSCRVTRCSEPRGAAPGGTLAGCPSGSAGNSSTRAWYCVACSGPLPAGCRSLPHLRLQKQAQAQAHVPSLKVSDPQRSAAASPAYLPSAVLQCSHTHAHFAASADSVSRQKRLHHCFALERCSVEIWVKSSRGHKTIVALRH